MHRPIIHDLTLESDSLSMADDCESLQSVDSQNSFQPLQPLTNIYESPIFKKPSGEEVLFITELFLPAKRERIYTQKSVQDFRMIRKRRNYHNQLEEYYEELILLETQKVNDGLMEEANEYLRGRVKKLSKEIEKVQEKEEVYDFPDFRSPIIQMIGMEELRERLPKKKGKTQRLIFESKQKKTSNPEFFQPESSGTQLFMQSLYDNIIQRQKISFSFFQPKLKKPRLLPGDSKNPFTPDPSHKKSQFFKTGQKINPLRFNPYPKPSFFFIPKFPSIHSLSSLIFSNKSDSDHILTRSSLSHLFPLPIKSLPNPSDSENSSNFSESEEPEAFSASKPEVQTEFVLHHCKFVYKYHLRKRFWTSDELLSFHRPKINIHQASVLVDIDPISTQSNLNNNSYLHFSKIEALTLTAGKFAVFEYIEQFPLLIQNSGMASRINNYFTEDVNEDYMGEVGANCNMTQYQSIRVLDPGKNLSFLENNLFVAPVFYHPAQGCDFLLVHTSDGRWIARNFSRVFTVGQQEPKIEVPAPKSKVFRETKDKHVLAALYEEMFLQGGEISKERFKEIVSEMGYKKNLKKTVKECKIVKKDESWVWEKEVEKEEFQKSITPEEFVAYESLLAGWERLKSLGISLVSGEKLLGALLTLKKELSDRNVHYVAGFIEDQVAVTSWNLSNCFLRGRKKSNFLMEGRADPTCGRCGYSFELLTKYTNKDLTEIKNQIKKNIEKEIKLLGNSWYKNDSSDESDEIEDEPIDYSMYYTDNNKADIENEEDQLNGFVENFNKMIEDKPKMKKVIKRTIVYPLLGGGFRKVVKFIDDPVEVSGFVQKKFPVPKIFGQSKVTKKSQEELKRQEMKIKLKEEERMKKQFEANKKKEEKKLEKTKQKLLQEQEWKNICIEKYNSGAVLFNTGTNANLRCSRCNMIGHVKSNKKLCPAYIEEKVDLEIDSKIILKVSELPNEPKVPKGKKGKKPKKKPVLPPPPPKPRSSRREISEFEQILVKLIDGEQDKELLSKPGGLLSLLEKSEKGHKWTIEEFEESLKEAYGEDYEYVEDEVEDLKFKQELRVPVKPVKKQSTSKIKLIEDSDTLIINTL